MKARLLVIGVTLAGSALIATGSASAAPRANVSLVSGFDLRIDGAAGGDYSGSSVAGAGDVNGDGTDDLIVGAYTASNLSGSSYVIYGGSRASTTPLGLAGLTASQGFRIDGARGSDQSGSSVAGAGDVNGDGVDDLIIGAYFADNGAGTISGSSYVIYGTTATRTGPLRLADLTATQGYRIDGAAAFDGSGASVAGAGDINGDGTDDVIIGAYSAANGGSSSGSSYVIYGTTATRTGPLKLADLTTTDGFRIDGAVNDFSGRSVAGAGDVNGDGTDDVVIGAQLANNQSGSSYVVYGTTATRTGPLKLADLTATQGYRIDGAAANDQSGLSVAGAADVNGDGTDDVVIGAYGADNGSTGSGSSYVVYGTTTARTAPLKLATLTAADGYRIDGAAADDESGTSVADAGDVNADGTDDLIIGAPRADNGGDQAGASYVIYGTTATRIAPLNLANLTTAQGYRIDGAAAEDSSGSSVAGAGDINGDDIDDVIVGAYKADNRGNDSGSSYVIFGRADVPAPPADQAPPVTQQPPAAIVPPASTRVRDTIAPAVAQARLSATRFAVGSRASASAAKPKRGRRVKLGFRLSEPATVTFTTQQRVGKRWRTVRVFAVRYRSAGRQTLNYSDRLRPRGKQRALKPGRYRLRIRASDPAGNRGTLTTLGFRIVR